jgi:hypothetical protein
MPQLIASLELLGGSEPASQFRVDVSIFAPEFIDPPNMHRCDIEIRPLIAGRRTLFGEGSLQALSLALQHAIECLEAYVDGGGALSHPDGTTFEPGSYGIRAAKDR